MSIRIPGFLFQPHAVFDNLQHFTAALIILFIPFWYGELFLDRPFLCVDLRFTTHSFA